MRDSRHWETEVSHSEFMARLREMISVSEQERGRSKMAQSAVITNIIKILERKERRP